LEFICENWKLWMIPWPSQLVKMKDAVTVTANENDKNRTLQAHDYNHIMTNMLLLRFSYGKWKYENAMIY